MLLFWAPSNDVRSRGHHHLTISGFSIGAGNETGVPAWAASTLPVELSPQLWISLISKILVRNVVIMHKSQLTRLHFPGFRVTKFHRFGL